MIDKEVRNYKEIPPEISIPILILYLVAIIIFAFIGGTWTISAIFGVPMVAGAMIMSLFIFGGFVYSTKFI